MCVCEKCQNALGFDDLCEEGIAEYEDHMYQKWQDEIYYMEYIQNAHTEPKQSEAESEDAAEHDAMYRLEKGA